MTREQIAQILRDVRTRAKLTQQQAADAIKRKRQTLASWETGQSQPDANTLFMLFDLYGASVDEEFGFAKNPTVLTPQERALVDAYRSAPEMQPAVNRILGIDSCEEASLSLEKLSDESAIS